MFDYNLLRKIHYGNTLRKKKTSQVDVYTQEEELLFRRICNKHEVYASEKQHAFSFVSTYRCYSVLCVVCVNVNIFLFSVSLCSSV